jgi:DNA-binding CsgD family transcriptional regulator/PAS domain-containing protein
MGTKISLAQFSHAVARIHEAGAAPERWTDALAAVMDLLEGSRISLMDIEAGSERLLGIAHLGHDPANARQYAEHYFAIDPTLAACLSAPPLKAATVYEQFPKAQRDRHEYFDFARAACDIGDVIGVGTAEACGRRAILSLQRPVGARAYAPEEKALVDLLAPHVQLAKRVQSRLGEAWSGRSELEAAFDRLTIPAFVLDGRASIRHLNTAAAQLLARHRQILSRRGKLAFAEVKLTASFYDAVRAAARDTGRSAALPIQLGHREKGEILVAPLHPRDALVAAWQTPLVLVAIATNERDGSSIGWRLRQLYRLTPAEARLAAALASGATLEQIAAAHRVTQATLRSQLRSVFSKTGTSRQAELVRLALRGAALGPDRRPG